MVHFVNIAINNSIYRIQGEKERDRSNTILHSYIGMSRMGEKDSINVNVSGNNATCKTVKAKYLRVVFAALLFFGIAMYTCCSLPHPTNLTRNPLNTEINQFNQADPAQYRKQTDLVNSFTETVGQEGPAVKKLQDQMMDVEIEKIESHKIDAPTTTVGFDKREDSSSSDSDSSETSDLKSTPVYDKPWMRFIFALGGIIVLNMIAICIHHLYLIVTRSQNRYRAFEEEKSPF